MKKEYILIMLLLSSVSYSTGKISFSEQRKIERSKNMEKEQLDVTNNLELNTRIISNNKPNRESVIRENIINFAKRQLGKPYYYGASGNQRFDCSSFTQYVYHSVGIDVPRVAAEQAQFKTKLTQGIKKGDLLFFETLGKGRISHVGIYIGNRKFIHASSKAGKVTVSEFSGFYANTFKWAVSVL